MKKIVRKIVKIQSEDRNEDRQPSIEDGKKGRRRIQSNFEETYDGLIIYVRSLLQKIFLSIH